MKAVVTVKLKDGVLDPQGKAIAHALQEMGFGEVLDARQGKVIELTLDAGQCTDKAALEKRLQQASDQLLANPIMEKFSVQIA